MYDVSSIDIDGTKRLLHQHFTSNIASILTISFSDFFPSGAIKLISIDTNYVFFFLYINVENTSLKKNPIRHLGKLLNFDGVVNITHNVWCTEHWFVLCYWLNYGFVSIGLFIFNFFVTIVIGTMNSQFWYTKITYLLCNPFLPWRYKWFISLKENRCSKKEVTLFYYE